MTCEAFEPRIVDYVENQLPAADRAALETHLAGCGQCQAFARQLRQLDAALAQRLKAPVLPPDFSERLRQRIRGEEPVRLSEAQRAERKRQLETEFEAGLAQGRMKGLGLAGLLDSVRGVILAALAGWAILALTPAWTKLAGRIGLDGLAQNLLFSCALAAVFLFVGLAAAFPQPFRRIWRVI